MRAVVLSEYGPPEVLVVTDVEEPQPGPGEVAIDVTIAGVNFGETQIRSGVRRLPTRRPPFVMGNEVAGYVATVGPGVDSALVGRRVSASLDGIGGYAERAVVRSEALIHVPETLDLEKAVALLGQGRTAMQMIGEAHIVGGERVLVEAAAGGTGSLLVQLAKRAGAGTVVAAARGRHKIDIARRLGADVTVDYSDSDWGDQIRDALAGEGLDVVFESVGGAIAQTAWGLLKDGVGRFLIFGFASGQSVALSSQEILIRGLAVTGFGLARAPAPQSRRGLMTEAVALAASGQLQPLIGPTFALDRAREAHEALESRSTTGKVLLRT